LMLVMRMSMVRVLVVMDHEQGEETDQDPGDVPLRRDDVKKTADGGWVKTITIRYHVM
jgi:hypothetical protein